MSETEGGVSELEVRVSPGSGPTRFLWRVGHLWVENPVWLVRFAVRILRAVPHALGELGTLRHMKSVLLRYTSQTVKTFLRGFVVVAVFGAAGAFALRTISGLFGPFLRPLLSDGFLIIVVENIAPLMVAVVVAARSGSAVAGKLASYPALVGKRFHTYTAGDMAKLVFPHIFAGVVTAGAFFAVVATMLLIGYGNPDPSAVTLAAVWSEVAGALEVGSPAWAGLAKTALFGGVVVYTAAAFGVQAAERFVSEQSETHDVHYAAWESAVTSLVICGALTAALWRSV